MPRIQLQSPQGMNCTITSGDPETIGRWFVEQLRTWGSGYEQYERWRAEVWPIWITDSSDRPAQDWCADVTHGDHRYFSFNNSVDGIIAALTMLKEGAQE
jgi:hypothetical protein